MTRCLPQRFFGKFAYLFLLTALFAAFMPCRGAIALSSQDKKHYQAAFKALDKGRTKAALDAAKRAKDGTLRKVIVSEIMASPGNLYSFSEIADFIEKNRFWPNARALTVTAEGLLPGGMSAKSVANWLTAHPPITSHAFDLAIEALQTTGAGNRAARMVRARWIDGNFSRTDQSAFATRFRNILRPSDHWARTERLLWEDDSDGVNRMLPLLTDGYPMLAQARQALMRERTDASHWVSKVPMELRGNPGLLYDRIRWARRRNMDEQAITWLQDQPLDLDQHGHDRAWWQERHILIRRLLDQGQDREAYRLAADNNLVDDLPKAQAEFMAGWIALRRLKQPQKAVQHFAKLHAGSSLPISLGRGAYWLGRAYSQLGDKKQATRWYDAAGHYPTTFYGQLALAERKGVLTIGEPPVAAKARAKIERQELIRIALQLRQIKQTQRFIQFLYAQAAASKKREEFIVLSDIARTSGQSDLAVKIAKKGIQKGIQLTQAAYPIPSYKIPPSPDKALVLALMRQESMFDADIVSPSGARGLMQIMPATGRELARKHRLKRFKNDHLFQPSTNLKLGCSYLDGLLNQFDGSVIMAVAGYNAGPSRVKQWRGQYGEPGQNIDAIDWIEMIPVYETRNYVQRVIEGLQIYRAALNKRATSIKIKQDLQGWKRR